MLHANRRRNSVMLFWVIMLLMGLACGSASTTPITTKTTDSAEGSISTETVKTGTFEATQLPVFTNTVNPTDSPITTATFTAAPIVSFLLEKNANIRSGPGTNFAVIAGAQAGDSLQVYGKNEDGTWLLIDPANYLWVSITLGKLSSPIETIPLAPTPTLTLTPINTSTPEPTATITPKPSSTNTATPTPTTEPPGLTDWLEYDGVRVRVVDIAWEKYIGYYSAESGKIYLSIYIVVVNNTDMERTFISDEFSVIDGSGTVNTANWFVVKEPEFSGCTIVPGGSCEGWWTAEVLDLPNVHENLILRWDTGWFSPDLETPINQE